MNQDLIETFIDARHKGTRYLAFLLAVLLAVSHFGQNLTAQLHPRMPCYSVEVCMHHKALSVWGRHRQGINQFGTKAFESVTNSHFPRFSQQLHVKLHKSWALVLVNNSVRS